MKKILPLKRCATAEDTLRYLCRNKACLLCVEDKQQNNVMSEVIIPREVLSGYTYREPHIALIKKMGLESVEPRFVIHYCLDNGSVIGSLLFESKGANSALYPRIRKLYDEVVAKQRVVEALDKFLVLDASKVPPIMQSWLQQQFGIKK